MEIFIVQSLYRLVLSKLLSKIINTEWPLGFRPALYQCFERVQLNIQVEWLNKNTSTAN